MAAAEEDELLALLEAGDDTAPAPAADAGDEAEGEAEGGDDKDSEGEDIMDFDALEDDDADEEEEDEESDDPEDAPARKKQRGDKKKKKRGGRSKFVDDAAGDSDESEEDESMAAGSDEDAELQDTSYIENYQRKKGFLEDEEGDEDEIAKRLEARYKAERQAERLAKEQMKHMGEGGLMAMEAGATGTMQFSADFLPKASDPKVFAVKCRPNTARQIVTRLTNKCHHYRMGKNHEQKRIDLGIISCFALDHVKEWFYVESHRQLFVENAVNGLENVFRYKMVRIDHSELMQLMMNTGKPKETVVVGDYCRLRMFPYKEDLAQVVALLENGRRAKVKVIPRVDFVQKRFMKPKKTDVRRPQRFFVPDLALGVRYTGAKYMWGDYSFDNDGYLELEVPVRALVHSSKLQKPSIDEIARFVKDDERKITDGAKFSSLVEEKVDFNIGDPVRVSRGELTGTVGRIIDLSPKDGMASLECRPPGAAPLEVRVELIDCSKYFPEGTRIEVFTGPTEGDTGTVLTQSGDLVVFLSDTTLTEATARSNNCHQCNIRPKERHTMGSWSVYDLVQLTDNSPGLIVKLATSGVSILTLNNANKVVNAAQIKQTLRPRVECLDAFNNTVRRQDAISVMPTCKIGNIVGKVGKVLQVYGETVFIRVDVSGRPSVIAAVLGKHVSVLGGVNKVGLMKQRRREVHLPDRPVYLATKPEGLSARYDAPSQAWGNTQAWDADGQQ